MGSSWDLTRKRGPTEADAPFAKKARVNPGQVRATP
jgi:hypothetical protein